MGRLFGLAASWGAATVSFSSREEGAGMTVHSGILIRVKPRNTQVIARPLSK